MAWKNTDNKYTQGERWFLLYNYLISHSSKTHPVSRKQIFDYMEANYNIKITPNTFYADLAILESAVFNLHVEHDKHLFRGGGGYYVSKPLFEPYELRLIIDSIQSSKFITQTTANSISKRMKGLACAGDMATMERPAVVADRVRNMEESVVKEADRIFEAINTDSKVSFRYFHRSPNKSNPKKYTKDGSQMKVSPFALLWNGGNYYLYAYDGKKFRTYRVDRMERIICLAERREGVEEYNEKTLTNQKTVVFDMYHGKEYRVSFRCHNRVADAVFDKFGDKVMLIPDGDEHFTFTSAVELSPPFFAWVATFGRSIKITNPPEAIEGMKQFLQKSMEMYEDD